ncbi:MAG: VIT1/CCC1 transporter family protein [Pseudomonadota bacterium]
MSRLRLHPERHVLGRVGWLRAAVLGANDGIVSTASLLLGVAAASPDRGPVLVAGVAALVAGAMSMAAGEYVSVSSQADAEQADLAKERRELAEDADAEREELTAIYVSRGLSPDLARSVADQLTAGDALAAHARDELGITDLSAARPLQAALASAAAFAAGAAGPLLVAAVVPMSWFTGMVSMLSLTFLAVLGAIGARAGGAPMLPAALRVCVWSALAMALTSVIGRIVGTAV